MSNNFKQAFNEVFGLEKKPDENQEAKQMDTKENEETRIPKQYENYEGFEKLEPTGKTIPEDTKTLIDKKANLFRENLNSSQTSAPQQESTASQNSSTVQEASNSYAQNEAARAYRDSIKSEQASFNNSASQTIKEEKQQMSQDTTQKSDETRKTPFFAKEFISKKDLKSSESSFENVLSETKETSLHKELSYPTNMADLSDSSMQSSYTLKPVATTFIDHGTKIEGKITSSSNLNIAGDVVGDINCSNDVFVSGNVEGSIACDNFIADSSSIKGNVNTKKTLVLKNNSSIVGDISADSIEISGKVNGNIISATELSIYANSAVIGDINAKSLSVEKGSVIQGRVNVSFE